jgi:hypothetical protein
MAESGMAESGMAESGMAESGMAESGMAESGMAESGMAESGPCPLIAAGFMDFNITIEIPKGERNKYELDHHTGRMKLDRTPCSPPPPTPESQACIPV